MYLLNISRIIQLKIKIYLKLNHLTLTFFVTTQFEMFTSFQRNLFTELAFGTFHPQHNFLGGFSLENELFIRNTQNKIIKNLTYLLSEDGLSLSSKTLLFPVITPSTLRSMTFLGLFILCYFVQFMYFTFLAKSTTLFRDVHLNMKIQVINFQTIFLIKLVSIMRKIIRKHKFPKCIIPYL